MEITDYINTKSSENGSENILLTVDEKLSGEEETDRKWVRCSTCNYKITLLSDKIHINSADVHIFKNPAGIIYRVICFSQAPGSVNITEYTFENSWFSGYSWSISLCRLCNNHLGWHYSSGSEEFYGLIAERILGI